MVNLGIKDKIQRKLIRLSQKLVNRAYRKEGATDEVLDMQVKVNGMRNEYNINDSDEEFVQ